MRKKMQNLLITTALWLLNKCHYQIPIVRPIKPIIIPPEFRERAMAQEKIDYWQLQEWAARPEYKFEEHIKRKVKEALAMRIAGDIETFTLRTPDGIIYRADVVYKDMSEYEKDLNLKDYE